MLLRQSNPVNGLDWGTAGARGNFATKKAFFDAETGAGGDFATRMAFFDAETGTACNFATIMAFFDAETASEYKLATKTWCFVAKLIFISDIL